MQRSIIDRVFPKPKALLPQYDDRLSTYHDDDTSTRMFHSTRSIEIGIPLSSSQSTTRRSSNSDGGSKSQNGLQAAPLSASLMHHDDPFLAVDRAAARLQQTIQSLLDFQSQSLSGRHNIDVEGSVLSEGSATPTLSATQASTTISMPHRVTPKRQPKQKPLTLKGTRRAIGDSMRELATLKEEELKLTVAEQKHRQVALDQVLSMETKTEAVQDELRLLKERVEGDQSRALRAEVGTIDEEIHELENRLMELKTRRRHLLDQATQIESAAASEISSYEGTLRSIEKQKQKFLRSPPVSHGLGPRSFSSHEGQDMYALRPERRTLELAKEQWDHELKTLESHKAMVERDYEALNEGAVIWVDTVGRIDRFERTLRQKMKENDAKSLKDLTGLLDNTTQHLQGNFKLARTQDWKLLICALGAELEAFRQARLLLLPDEDLPPFYEMADPDVQIFDTAEEEGLDSAYSQATAVNGNRSISSSNESLEATLRQFSPSEPVTQAARNEMQDGALEDTGRSSSSKTLLIQPAYSESEDDEPGPDFLISHTS